MKTHVLILRLTFILCICYPNVFAQNGTLRGIIYDEILEPAMGATIMVEQVNMYAVSDINGLFIIPDIPFGTYKLQVSYIGYGTQFLDVTIKQKNSDLLKVYLQEESTQLRTTIHFILDILMKIVQVEICVLIFENKDVLKSPI